MYENMCLVLDMGGGQSAAIARMVRGERVYCEVLPSDVAIARVEKRTPRGLILAGDTDEREVNPAIFELGVPILGIGAGARALATRLGVKRLMTRTDLDAGRITLADSPLFKTLSDSERLLKRLDILELPDGVSSIATYQDINAVAFQCAQRNWYGMQFYPEKNDPDGLIMLNNFATGICGCAQTWSLESFLDEEIEYVRNKIGDRRALMSISGGVDSAVCAMLVRRAIGEQMTCVYVDTGFLPADEDARAKALARDVLRAELVMVDGRDRFLHKIQGVGGTQEKCILLDEEMHRVFAETAADQGAIPCFIQGTTYDDTLDWSDADTRQASCPDAFALVLEPIGRLFKDEVRLLGAILELPQEIVMRPPFPSAGFAMRCGGCVTAEKIQLLRRADKIFSEEMAASGQSKRARQFFAVLADCKNAGAGHMIALRAVNPTGAAGLTACRLPYDMLERLVERFMNELPGVVRVVYDLTGGATSQAEWL